MKFSIKDFLSKCDQIRSFLRICSGLLKNSLMENFIFCGVLLDKMMALANNIDISKAMGKVFETSCVVLLAFEVSLHCRVLTFFGHTVFSNSGRRRLIDIVKSPTAETDSS